MHLPPNIKQRIVNLLLFVPPQHQRRSAKKVVFEALELIDDTARREDDAIGKGAGWCVGSRRCRGLGLGVLRLCLGLAGWYLF
jgi:hypothetical protein